jgi:hypothetical protein
MSKRDEIRERRRREGARNRILMVLLVVGGALLITFALVSLSNPPGPGPAQETQTRSEAPDQPVVPITPRSFNMPVDGAGRRLGRLPVPGL